MNLASCLTTTTVSIVPGSSGDLFLLNGKPAGEKAHQRVMLFLDEVRRRSGRREHAKVESRNSFPTGSGIASSASGFAALAVAAAAAYGLDADLEGLSRLARLGSGSAARSIPAGFVELREGNSDEEARAVQIAPETHWPELRDVIVISSPGEKGVSSADGHRLARSSEMLAARLAAVPERVGRVRRAIVDRDLTRLGEAAEEDALSMHAVMMTSRPPLLYWEPATLEAVQKVRALRAKGVEAYFTMDAGPNVHVITLQGNVEAVRRATESLGAIRVETPGPGARIVTEASS